MFPADFSYARARSLDEALDLLDEAAEAGDEAKLIAGGQSLLPMMKLRLAAPQVLIDIAGLPELRGGGFYGAAAGGSLSYTIGALSTYRQLGRDALLGGGLIRGRTENGPPRRAEGIPAVTDALTVLADPQVRARGTIGGAVAHGDPAADLPAVLLALNAEVVIAARPGRHEHKPSQRHLPRSHRPHDEPSNVEKQTMLLDDFLQGVYATDLAEDEIITHVRITTQDGRASAYEKFPHPASHLPLAGVAVVLTFKSGTLTDSGGRVASLHDGSIADAAIAVTGISPRPYRARAAEAVLQGAFPAPDTLAAAAAAVARAADGTELSLLGDQHASGPYRAHLAEVLTRRALTRALARVPERRQP
jgi:aerobic carbon-monoxide dehydrogenase medium subunit